MRDGVNIYKKADKVFDDNFKGMVAEGKEGAVRQTIMRMYDKVAPKQEQFPFLQAALGVWNSIGDFAQSYVQSPLVRDDPKVHEAIDVVKLATCPLEEGFDRKHAANTGWTRGDFPGIRDRRQNPRKHQHSKGLLRKIRQAKKGSEQRLAKRVKAYQFWVRKTSPRNLGAGKRDMVSSLLCSYTD